MNTLKEILLYIWQLPQNLIGLVMMLFMKPYISKEKYKGITYVVSKKMSGGISLGNYIILSKSYEDKVRHQKTWDQKRQKLSLIEVIVLPESLIGILFRY